MDDFQISKDFLQKILDNSARCLVGTIMKRFEILSNSGDIKKSIKELIYENYRVLRTQIESFSYGVEFKPKPKNDKKS